jgi:thiamine pyrophosphate-dependent acetolactate synthase large subunit-like protein
MAAVHHKLPVKVVIFNNSAFGLIPLEADTATFVPFGEGIEFPNSAFAAFAYACADSDLRRRCQANSSQRSAAYSPRMDWQLSM